MWLLTFFFLNRSLKPIASLIEESKSNLSQIALPTTIPRKAASSPVTILPKTFTSAIGRSPFCIDSTVATVKVENVVYDPKKPTAMKIRVSEDQSLLTEKSPVNKPRMKDPLVFAINVPINEEPM